jgi:hypothetical protein
MRSLLTVILGLLLSFGSAKAQLYIAPNGSDANPGTELKPFASLVGARDAIRKLKKEHQFTSPITVTIKGGHYMMTEPLVLLPEDGGTADFPITYRAAKGEIPIFSGGKRITGFTVDANGVWQANIPECRYYGWRFDQLYVNGQRAVMARTPNKGFLEIGNVKENVWERGNGPSAVKAQQVIAFDSSNFKPIMQITHEDLQNARFRVFHKWDFTLRFIDRIEKDSSRIYTSGEGMKPWNPMGKGDRIVFENYAAALDTAGEWYLNSQGILRYIPRPGETPENAEVIAPALDHFISVKGDAASNHYVEHIKFEGITFEHCLYRMPHTGSEPNQAAALVGSAVMLTGARDITFTNCEISKTGQHAIWFGKGCSGCEVNHCYLYNLGGGGIYLGDINPQEGVEHTHHIKLHNNIIQTGGLEFPSAVGVWISHSSDNEISHNDIGNFYYTGVSVGWIWGYAPSNAKRNLITYNHIHHIGWALLSDMAAVYTLGKSEGTVISNNVIHHVHAYSYGGWGLYTDEGSSDILLENNLVYSTKTGGFHQHYGCNNTVRNNIFAYAKQYQLQCTRVEDHLSFSFTNNIVIFDQGVLLQGAWQKIRIEMDKNLYWNTKQPVQSFANLSFDQWKKLGHDTHSIVADPYFSNPEKFDFTFKSNRNIRRIGFTPFDYSKAGVYGDEQWKEKSHLPQAILQAFDREVEQNMGK